MTMKAGILRTMAAYATPWAWLPDEWVQTDEGSLSWSSLLNAPLGLKAPTF